MQQDEIDILSVRPGARPAWAGAAGEIAPTRLGDAVIDRLTSAILEGHLKPGDALPSEAQIASTFGVSKPIAREALRELAAMGVVQVQQGKISRVRAIDSEPLSRFYRFAMARTERGLHEAVELRRLLEPPIARFAAQRRTEPELAELRAIMRRMNDALGDIPGWIEVDLAFHRHLATMAHNGLLSLQMQGLEPIVREMMEAFNARSARTGADWSATFARHALLADAIEAGDADAAERASRAHFAAADQAIAEIFGSAKSD
ncbi:FadR/GntR family transcriptional regulator [Terrarubrum flagellatum]|uniref:FadR/GntR family transcriptional regulator n=1 Tax=Terrirubrum flagellatum TaxID=2895980 RepID=UPI003144E29A